MGLFKLDENLPAEATELFQAAGHDALSALDQALGGQTERTNRCPGIVTV
jgi:hypothetical protein